MQIQIPRQCNSCNIDIISTSPAQKYCSSCAEKISKQKGKERMRKYVKKVYAATKEVRTKELKEKGTQRNSEENHATISYNSIDDFVTKKDFSHMLRFWIPYDINLSKNRLWKTTRTGHVYTASSSKKLIELIGTTVKLSKIKWNINKVYLEIIVQKPTMRGDAINFLDAIADGVKLGLPLDDNWFAVEKLDWEIVKDNPRIYISVMQEAVNKFPCRYCGIFQTLNNYGKDVNSKYGITGECKTCLKR